MVKFNDDQRRQITAVIHATERKTSGEFVAVVARASDHYLGTALAWAAGLALLLPGLLLFTGMGYVHIYQLQLALFTGLMLLFALVPDLHLALVPKRVKHAAAACLARMQFHQQGVHLTRDRSGVLFFVSLAEHYVEIVADAGIHEKIGEKRWQEIVGGFVERVGRHEVVDGFSFAIRDCGEAMARHYPARPDDTDELSDGLIEI